MVSDDQNANPDNRLTRSADGDLHRADRVPGRETRGETTFWTVSRQFAGRWRKSLKYKTYFTAGEILTRSKNSFAKPALGSCTRNSPTDLSTGRVDNFT
jgi:hypothetical protein